MLEARFWTRISDLRSQYLDILLALVNCGNVIFVRRIFHRPVNNFLLPNSYGFVASSTCMHTQTVHAVDTIRWRDGRSSPLPGNMLAGLTTRIHTHTHTQHTTRNINIFTLTLARCRYQNVLCVCIKRALICGQRTYSSAHEYASTLWGVFPFLSSENIKKQGGREPLCIS